MSLSSFLTLTSAIALASTLVALPLHAQTAFPATLAGHAVLPAMSLIAAPGQVATGSTCWRPTTTRLATST